MPEFIQQIRSFYEGLEPTRRRTLWAALIVSLLTIAGVGVWASQPRYRTLTTPTDAEERADIVDALSRSSIGWRLGADGNSIEVLEADHTRARAAAASDHGILGLEGLEQIDPWATPFVEMLQKQRMLQGEIIRSVNRMDGIARSACILNLPSPSEFIGRTSQATAAVTVSPEAGATITPATARAIAELVSHAVAGMTVDDVSVVDTSTGRALWSGSAAATPTSEADAATARREAELTAKVDRVLSSVLGSPDNFAVAVMVDVSTATVESLTNSVDPDSAAPTTERIETEANSAAATPGGAPGVDSNLPERAGGTATAGTNRSRERQDTTYQYTRTSTKTSQPAGEIKRLSASVVVNLDALTTLAAGQAVDEAAQKARLEGIVKAALGADAARGDSVVVELTPFATPTLSDDEGAVPTPTAAETWAPAAIAAAAVVLLLLLVVRPLLRAATAASQPAAAAAEGGEGLSVAIGDEGKGAEVVDLAARLRRHVETFKPITSEEVSALVRQESDGSAEVLRRWMKR